MAQDSFAERIYFIGEDRPIRGGADCLAASAAPIGFFGSVRGTGGGGQMGWAWVVVGLVLALFLAFAWKTK